MVDVETNGRADVRSGLERYNGLRVTDVCDGMDAIGMMDMGMMNRDIVPLWRDLESFKHRIYGVAHTVRFVPTQRPVPAQSPEEFYDWMREWYQELAQGPIRADIKPGDLIVIDGFELGTTGFIGSNNALSWITLGAVGVVTNGGARDTDELIKQQVPVYSRYISRTIRPGRIELDATQVKVNVGGAVVNPGDVVVADGDGVVVVPAAKAEDVAEHAWRHATKDKEKRRALYAEAGLPEDWTLS
ncbi:RraA family protein [Tenggerimyces flavus]|uniref:Putative 4-hydroxy-4-methyl-2-oxoglutarate aldolase n=1 Tax=Tenggerimyces flavus TaxID=1708749 RepID=A0ABV7YBX1_9ACTN|nr:RraA family protein [Tenggerimyces flavus]MBM7783821.1 regulator of RNase E activity RraA [Tenggerimyces flavus]